MAKQRRYGTTVKKMKTASEYCFYCEKKMSEQNKTIDHIVPIKKGGSNCLNNFVICCGKCNRVKGKSTIVEVIEQLETQYKYADENRKQILIKQIAMWKRAKEKMQDNVERFEKSNIEKFRKELNLERVEKYEIK